jgi:V/A-type H+-transporting ATPase subunit I
MAVLSMKHMEVIALQHDAKAIVELLQRAGVVEITRSPDPGDDPKSLEPLERLHTNASVQEFDKNLQRVNAALFALQEYVPVKKSILAGVTGRKELSLSEFSDRSHKVDASLHKVHEIVAISKRIESERAFILHTRQQLESILPWEDLDIPMQHQGSAHTAAFIGSLPAMFSEESLLHEMSESDDGSDSIFPDVFVQIVSASPELTCIVVLCHTSDESVVWNRLRRIGFSIPSDPTQHPPAVRIARLRQAMKDSQKSIDASISQLGTYKDTRESLEFLSDYLLMRKDKYDALSKLAFSRKAFVLNGYVPAKESSFLAEVLERNFTVSVQFEDTKEDEDVPVLLSNNFLVSPVEDISSDYSLPSKSDIDPNPIMAFFYYLFFGMMLSDAGYGLLLVIGTGCILYFRNPEGLAKVNMQKFLYCGLSTVFWGAMFGSWFGNIVYSVSTTFMGHSVSLNPVWFDPVADPLKLLIFSLILGFIHVMTGLVIKFYLMWKNGDRLDALLDIGLWWVVFFGLGAVILNMVLPVSFPLDTIGLGIAAAGGVGLVFTQGRSNKSIAGKIVGGITSLYSITGYFSDVLSYSRLMALGLVTGIIATVVNTIGSIAGGGITGALVFIPVFLFGHAINIGINVLGAYVHGNRLQYVEFFSKFYEGGGKPFRPFRVQTKHYKFKEEK